LPPEIHCLPLASDASRGRARPYLFLVELGDRDGRSDDRAVADLDAVAPGARSLNLEGQEIQSDPSFPLVLIVISVPRPQNRMLLPRGCEALTHDLAARVDG
jgi:hypothetical protein